MPKIKVKSKPKAKAKAKVKMKSHSGASKRFTLTGTGKVRRAQANRRHILTKKDRSRKRALRALVVVSAGEQRRMHQLLAR